MKLRLIQKNFETYTGQMGVVFFENGLSVGEVSPLDAVRISAVMACEWEDGAPSNVSQIYLDNMHTKAPMPAETTLANDATASEETLVTKEMALAAELGVTYTEDQLAAVADEKGIAGLREIADPLGIRNNSIRGLIDAIIKVAGAKAE